MPLRVLSEEDPQLADVIRKHYYFHPEFRRDGILKKRNFWDITCILRKEDSFQAIIEYLRRYSSGVAGWVDAVVGLESKGFFVAPIVAAFLGKPFVPMRKKGKALGTTRQIQYQLEYSSDTFEMEIGSLASGQKVLLVDDFLATGGSLSAGCQLVQDFGCKVEECLVVCTQENLEGHKKVPVAVTTLLILNGSEKSL